MPGYSVETVTTRQLPVNQRLALWSETVTAFQFAMRFDYPNPDHFHAVATRQHTSSFQLSTWSISQPQTIHRSRRQVRTDPGEHFRLVVPTHTAIDFSVGDEQMVLAPGSGRLFAPDTLFDLRLAEGSTGMVVTIPGAEIESRIDHVSPHGQPLALTHGLGRLLATVVTTLVDERDSLSSAAFDLACTQTTDLAAMIVTGDAAAPPPALADQIRRHIRRHAHDPVLTGTRIARDLGWSLRQIQTALQETGTTPSRLIREERLHLARTRLANPAYHRHTITAIAHASGFDSVDTFTRAFRNRYGATPTGYRRGVL